MQCTLGEAVYNVDKSVLYCISFALCAALSTVDGFDADESGLYHLRSVPQDNGASLLSVSGVITRFSCGCNQTSLQFHIIYNFPPRWISMHPNYHLRWTSESGFIC